MVCADVKPAQLRSAHTFGIRPNLGSRDDAPRLNLAFAAGYMFVGAYRVNLVSVFLDFQ